jgi:hypothetical protein
MTQNVFFHLAIPIKNIDKAKEFYVNALGCSVGRESDQAMILDFWGHQVVAHMTPLELTPQKGIYPRHFGIIFANYKDWETCLANAQKHNLNFREKEKLRFPEQTTEHSTFFLEDPFFNLLEFKHYRYPEAIFSPLPGAAVGDRE